MKDVPFPISNWRADPHWMVKSFFNYVCEQGALIHALEAISNRQGYAYNEEYCFFPDLNDPDPSFHFDGVAFGVSDEEVVITEAQCWEYTRKAALFWMERNKEDAVTVKGILLRVPH
ncbi:ribonuclease toxin immunity protein CdiI [Duganella sp.]|uniref:ribonuclease toxin immunity protein CdiI n=1 Tax=Duganella sp. TaxID=1904440 RepID=UPI0031CFB772